MRRRWLFLTLGWVLALGVGTTIYALWPASGWSADQIKALRGLWLGSLKPLPPDPSNAVADNPRAAALGHKLFFDARLSKNGAVSCASCHLPSAFPTKAIGFAAQHMHDHMCVYQAWDVVMIIRGHFRKSCLIMH